MTAIKINQVKTMLKRRITLQWIEHFCHDVIWFQLLFRQIFDENLEYIFNKLSHWFMFDENWDFGVTLNIKIILNLALIDIIIKPNSDYDFIMKHHNTDWNNFKKFNFNYVFLSLELKIWFLYHSNYY